MKTETPPGTPPEPIRGIRVLETAVYRGPHLYASLPMIRMQVDLGALEEWPSDRLPGLHDEDTAIVLREGKFTVIGSGAVYIVDCAGVTYSNIAEARSERALSADNVRLHVLSSGDGFDLATRRPTSSPELA